MALKSPVHITLVLPFWLQESREGELQQALQSLPINIKEIEISLDDFSHFGKKVLFINVKNNHDLEKIKQKTEEYFIEMLGDSINKEDQPFHPHVTIANRDLKPSGFIKAWEYFSKKKFKETFRIRTISLLKLSRQMGCHWRKEMVKRSFHFLVKKLIAGLL